MNKNSFISVTETKFKYFFLQTLRVYMVNECVGTNLHLRSLFHKYKQEPNTCIQNLRNIEVYNIFWVHT